MSSSCLARAAHRCVSPELRGKASYTSRPSAAAAKRPISRVPAHATPPTSAPRPDGMLNTLAFDASSLHAREKHHRFAIAVVGLSSFLSVTVAGFCLALGIAIGQRTRGGPARGRPQLVPSTPTT